MHSLPTLLDQCVEFKTSASAVIVVPLPACGDLNAQEIGEQSASLLGVGIVKLLERHLQMTQHESILEAVVTFVLTPTEN